MNGWAPLTATEGYVRKTTLLVSMIVALLAMAWSAIPALAETSKTCHFTTGPRKGQTIDYNDTPGVQPVQVGWPCTDGFLSFGTAVADADDEDDDEEADDDDDGDDPFGADDDDDDDDDDEDDD